MLARCLISLALLAALFPSPAHCAGPFIIMEAKGLSMSLTAQEAAEGKEAAFEAAMPDPVTFILKRDTPNGLKISVIYNDTGENLRYALPQAMQGFNDFGELEEHFSIQVASCDLTGDGVPEILVATGDGVATLTVAICVSRPGGEERFRCLGLIEGQKELRVRADRMLSVPYGSQGLFTEYQVTDRGISKRP